VISILFEVGREREKETRIREILSLPLELERERERAMEMNLSSINGFGEEALYVVIILWLLIISCIIFSSGDDCYDCESKRQRRNQAIPFFLEESGFEV
jgi:hypothetical protein